MTLEHQIEVVKAVILARGLGTRMRRPDDAAELEPAQQQAADAGVKALVPVGAGRPFLDYVLTTLSEAGYREVCLVTGPEHAALREYYSGAGRPQRLSIHFAMQERPLGTADAVAAAAPFAGDDLFLMINSDNYYPPEVLRGLRALGRPALAAFEHDVLVRESNIPAERVRHYALLEIGPEDELVRIVEKPDEEMFAAAGPQAWVSMNCWVFGPAIFPACAQVRPSARGELELADAVQYAIDSLGERFHVLRCRGGVLDLSHRSDISSVAARLRGVEVRY